MLLLETRLDNVVYRMGFASTRAEARQLVVHRHILVSENKNNIFTVSTDSFSLFSQLKWYVVNIPSFQVKIGYYVGIKRIKMSQQRIKDSGANEEDIDHLLHYLTEEFEAVKKRLIVELHRRGSI